MKKLKLILAALLIANFYLFAMDAWGFGDFWVEDEQSLYEELEPDGIRWNLNDPECINGGPGTTSCGNHAGVGMGPVDGSAGCSVSCGLGHYACCGVVCKCKLYIRATFPGDMPAI